ncbi:MAG: Tol-Pal system beta propeller repeat protein TolB [bacterium]
MRAICTVLAVCFAVLAAIAAAAEDAGGKIELAKAADSRASHPAPSGSPVKQDASRGGAPSAEPTAQSQNIGAVRPSNLVLPQMGVSAFDGGAESATIAEIVQNDLELADAAIRPRNQQAAAAAAAQDKQSGGVSYDGWAAAGVMYVLRGVLNGSEAQSELYDIASKQRVLGNNYTGFAQKGARKLAHKIADDIMTALSNPPGIFSSQICCLMERGGGRREVMVMDADGAGARQLTNEGAIVTSPAWGRNGTEIYYTSYRDNNPDLYGVTLAGQRFEISRRPGLNTSPSWSESLQRIAVTLSKDGNSEIYTMTRDGRDLARLTNSPDTDTATDWSPDGSRIAFTSDRDGKPQIYVMSAGGGDAQRISTGGYCDSPSWSPDSRKLAYVVREGGEFNIYVADLTSGGPAVQLMRGQRDNKDPSWAPDSKHIVFTSNRGGAMQIYMMNTDVKTAHQLTRNAAGCSSPAWGPLTR